MAAGSTGSTRDYDIVVFGATGFSGKVAAEYLAAHYLGQGDVKLRVALGGRNRQKLEALKAELATVEPAASELGILLGNSDSLEDMVALARRAKVVASTAGPFTLYGSKLVEACAQEGTSYCDITGEASWVERMSVLFHEKAQQTGARIVCCAGFDSVPSDMGTWTAVKRFRSTFGRDPERVDAYVTEISGGVQGGTINTAVNELSGGGAHVPDGPKVPSKGQTEVEYPKGLWYDSKAGLWTVPYFMSPANYPIVQRSNAQMGYAKNLRYKEHMAGSLPFCSAVLTGLVVGGLSLLFPPTRWLVRRFLPDSGDGPTRQSMLAGCCKILFVASSGSDQARVLWHARGDPSCIQTTIYLVETAVCLLDGDRLPSQGGVLAPVSACGDCLWQRLSRAKWQRGDAGPAITLE